MKKNQEIRKSPLAPVTRERHQRRQKYKVRYAVVGQGYISQVAVLPAFRHAARNSELVALVSDDPVKLRKLGRRYEVDQLCGYGDFDELLASGEIDAVYIALPNHLHRDYAVRAARAGVHVLCEKPMEVDSERCVQMIEAARESGVKLMIAYRLHFEGANLCAAEMIHRGRKVGEPRIFNSVFTMALDPKNYRAGPREKGGGPLFDIGIYCINASRFLFRSEPIQVSAMQLRAGPSRRDTGKTGKDTIAVSLRFPGERIANFVCSYGTVGVSRFEVLGTQGVIQVQDAYELAGSKTLELTVREKTVVKETFRERDQFAPELLYFSDCILKDLEPEPSGLEGLADVRIIQAIFEAADTGRAVTLAPIAKRYADLSQEASVPPVRKPKLVHAKGPSRKEAA